MNPSVDDRFFIEDLFARYSWALDTADTDDLVGCFTEDGVLDVPVSPAYEVARAVGRPAIRGLVSRAFHGNPDYAGFQHHGSQLQFLPAADGATTEWRVRSFFFSLLRRPIYRSSPYTVGYYDDIVAKVGDQWLFRLRVARPWSGEVLSGFTVAARGQADREPAGPVLSTRGAQS
jgi:hypothetical protein